MANDNCSVRKDWAELNPDFLPLIAHELGDIIDFIRFRAVCKQWRLATNLSDKPPQFPWLMMLKLNRNSNISFHALPSGKIFSINEPVTTKISRRGSNEFMLNNKNVFDFYNEHCKTSLLDKKADEHTTIFSHMVNRLSCNLSGREVVPSPPVGNISEFFYFKSDRMPVTMMHVPYMRYHAHHMENIFLYDYGNTTTQSHVVVLDDTTRDVVSTISCPEESLLGCWLISTKDGVLLVVHINVPPQYGVPYVDHRFVVYHLENYCKQPRWTKLSGIGDMMLFLDDCNPFSLMASDYDGYRGNCIYFITHLKKNPIFFGSNFEYVLLAFDMKENRCFEVRSLGEATAFATKIYWFIPSHY